VTQIPRGGAIPPRPPAGPADRPGPARPTNLVAGLSACLWLSALGGCGLFAGATRDDELRLVVWNIRHGKGMDGRVDLERISRVLRPHQPNLIALQEVDEGTRRAGRVDQAARLALGLGLESAFSPFMDYDGGRYGLATLHRARVLEVRSIALPPGPEEPRTALLLVLDQAGIRFVVVNAHLDWLEDDDARLLQAAAIAQALESHQDLPCLLLGDFNDDPDSPALAIFAGAGFVRLGPDAPTFPAPNPRDTIDHVLQRPSPTSAFTATAVEVLQDSEASDHRPILARLRLVPASPGPRQRP
jgi:endonuclease/exonuclease/phosphatase family metal-dependent hydrolase